MRKRETLIESKKNVNKFDYHVSVETFVQTVDSHIEALDEIARLEQDYVFLQNNWYREEDRANLLSLENDRLRASLEHAQAERDLLREYIRVIRETTDEDPTDPT